MNTFNFVGKIKKTKENSLTTQEYDSGWTMTRLKFVMTCGNNTHFMDISGGKWKDEAKNVVYTWSKADKDEKSEKLTVDWEDRLDPEVIKSVAPFKRFVVDLDTVTHRIQLEKDGETEALEKSKKLKKEFIHELDFIACLNKVMESGKYADKLFRVQGNIEYSYSEKDGKFYRNFTPTRVYLADEDAENLSDGVMDFYFTSDCINKDATDETGEILLNGFTSYYNRFSKATAFAPLNLIIPQDDPKANGVCKLLADIKDDEVKHIGFKTKFMNGSQQAEITMDDLDEDTRTMIEWGLKTFDEVKKELGGSAYGDRITKDVVVGIGQGYSWSKETAYSIESLTEIPTSQTQPKDVKKDTKKSKKKEEFDLFDDDIDEI